MWIPRRWPCPLTLDELATLRGARLADGKLPAPALPSGSISVQRHIGANVRIMIAGRAVKLGKRHHGKDVTVVIEDTYLRILHDGEEIAVRERTSPGPLTRIRIYSRRPDSQKPTNT